MLAILYGVLGLQVSIVTPRWILVFADQSDSDVDKPITRYAIEVSVLNESLSNATAVVRDIVLALKDTNNTTYSSHMRAFQLIKTLHTLSLCDKAELDVVPTYKNPIGVPAIAKDYSTLYNCASRKNTTGAQNLLQLGPEIPKERAIPPGGALSGELTFAAELTGNRMVWEDMLLLLRNPSFIFHLSIQIQNDESFDYECFAQAGGTRSQFGENAHFVRLDVTKCNRVDGWLRKLWPW